MRAVREVAKEVGATAAQVAIAWTMARSRAVHPIIAVSDPGQLTENLAATDLDLPDEAVRRLTAALEFEAGFPADFIAECEAGPWVFGDAAARTDGRW